MKEMNIVSFDTSLILFFLYFPCIILTAFSVGLFIFWLSLKTTVAIERRQVWERILIFVVLIITCFVMLLTDLSISNMDLFVFWPSSVFWSCVIIGIPGLIFSTLFIVMKCIESWSDACSGGQRYRYLYLLFLSCWLFCCFIQLIIFSLVIKNIGGNSMLDSFN